MSRLAAFLVACFVLLHHFEILQVAGYAVTVGALAGAASLLLVPIRIDLPTLTLGSLFLWTTATLPLFLSDGALASTELYRTVALFQSAILILSVRVRSTAALTSERFARTLLLALAAVSGYSILQVLAGTLGSDAFFNPFGDHQYLYEYRANVQFVDVPRAQGFYLEPSYAAFVILTLGVILLGLGFRSRTALLLTVAGTLATQSATGILTLTALLVLRGLLVGGRRRAWTSLGALLALGITAGPYIAGRLMSVTATGSSANYRLIAPIRVLQDVFEQHPLGAPMGSLDSAVRRYSLLNGTEIGSSIDNGLYVIVYYWGYLGIVIVAAILFLAVRAVTLGGGPERLIPSWIALSLLFSGGIMLPEFVFFTWFSLNTYRAIRTRDGGRTNLEDATHNRGGHVSGHPRRPEDVDVARADSK